MRRLTINGHPLARPTPRWWRGTPQAAPRAGAPLRRYREPAELEGLRRGSARYDPAGTPTALKFSLNCHNQQRMTGIADGYNALVSRRRYSRD
jgi:hypothetical protein